MIRLTVQVPLFNAAEIMWTCSIPLECRSHSLAHWAVSRPRLC